MQILQTKHNGVFYSSGPVCFKSGSVKVKTAMKRVRILFVESKTKTLESVLSMLAFSFQTFAIIFNCLHRVILF